MDILQELIQEGVKQQKITLDPFIYTAEWNTLGASATTAVNVSVNADSDFVFDRISLGSYTAAGTRLATPDYTLQIYDTGSGRNLQDASVHVLNITSFAQGGYPYPMGVSKLVKAASVLTLTLVNRTATASRVDVALIGFKIFYWGGFHRGMLGVRV